MGMARMNDINKLQRYHPVHDAELTRVPKANYSAGGRRSLLQRSLHVGHVDFGCRSASAVAACTAARRRLSPRAPVLCGGAARALRSARGQSAGFVADAAEGPVAVAGVNAGPRPLCKSRGTPGGTPRPSAAAPRRAPARAAAAGGTPAELQHAPCPFTASTAAREGPGFKSGRGSRV